MKTTAAMGAQSLNRPSMRIDLPIQACWPLLVIIAIVILPQSNDADG
jgi:hypothetical protein